MELIKDRQINVPEGGWKERTWYVVEMSMNRSNPVFKGLLYTGFLSDGKPCGYHTLFSINTPDEKTRYSELHYLKVIREIEV